MSSSQFIFHENVFNCRKKQNEIKNAFIYLYCWSIWAFSMRLSLARRFWNQILICVSVNCKRSANSKRRPRDIYSLRWNSTSKRMVCSLLNVVRCRLGRPSFRLRRATMQIIHTRIQNKKKDEENGENKIIFNFTISMWTRFFFFEFIWLFSAFFHLFWKYFATHTVSNTLTKKKKLRFWA